MLIHHKICQISYSIYPFYKFWYSSFIHFIIHSLAFHWYSSIIKNQSFIRILVICFHFALLSTARFKHFIVVCNFGIFVLYINSAHKTWLLLVRHYMCDVIYNIVHIEYHTCHIIVQWCNIIAAIQSRTDQRKVL